MRSSDYDRGGLGIVLAMAGFGVWALVLQVLAQRIAELVIAWIAVPVRFGLTWSAPHFHELRPVAVNVFSARMMSLVTGQFPRLVLGYTVGAIDVGLFALGNRFLDIIVHTTVVPRTAVGRIELREAQIGTPEFELDFAKMLQNASILSYPFFFGTAALIPLLFQVWLSPEWQPGIVPAQLIVLGGVPMVLLYSIDAALLAGNLSSDFRKIANLQGVTVAVTVLIAAQFGLTSTCLALAVRPWFVLPVVLILFRRAAKISARRALAPSIHSLIGGLLMAGALSLPLLRLTWMNAVLELVILVIAGIAVYFSYLSIFARDELRTLFSAVLSRLH